MGELEAELRRREARDRERETEWREREREWKRELKKEKGKVVELEGEVRRKEKVLMGWKEKERENHEQMELLLQNVEKNLNQTRLLLCICVKC